MPTKMKFDSVPSSGLRWMALAGVFCVSSLSLAQNTLPPQNATPTFNVQAAIALLNKGEISSYDLTQLGQQGVKQAIPALEKQFFLVQQEMDKAQIAQVLVKLKDPDDVYWNYLAQLVTPLLTNPAPSPIATDAQGKELPGVSPTFEAWVDFNKLDPPTALQDATVVFPGYMLFLGKTDDSRAIPLLRRAVTSPNYLVAVAASEALAELKDEDSASVIADAAARAPASAAALIAEPLGYLKSSTA